MHALRPNRRDSPMERLAVNATRLDSTRSRSLLPSVGAIANDPRFPPKAAIDGNAIRDWTPHMISRPVHRAVLLVCRNREDLAWISAFKLDCSYLRSLSLSLFPPPPLARLRFGPLPRRFSFRLARAFFARDDGTSIRFT